VGKYLLLVCKPSLHRLAVMANIGSNAPVPMAREKPVDAAGQRQMESGFQKKE
jgi:hypothetical protein